MKTVVGVYETREEGVKAVTSLTNHGFRTQSVTLVNKDELLHKHITVRPHNTLERIEIIIGFIAGAVLGAMVGYGLFDFAPLHFLYEQGIVMGAISGGIFGLLIGAVIGFILMFIENGRLSSKYESHLNEGKYLVVLNGTRKQVSRAHEVINTPDLDIQLD